MRVVVGQLRELTPENLRFAKQIGASGVTLNTPHLTGRPPFGSGEIGARNWAQPGDDARPVKWDFLELLHLRQKAEDFGLRLEAIENVPRYFYEKAILGLPGRDEQIENVQHTIRNLGKAGIPILGYHWMSDGVWRTSKSRRGRGGALVAAYDHTLTEAAPPTRERVFSDDEMWANYTYFIKAVVPVAEEVGVRLALHPDDPPVRSLGGVARIFSSFDGFRRALDIVDSPCHGLDFCMGTWSEMGIEEMFKGLRHFGERKRIFYVHFRNVRGTVPCFEETFIDEGDVDVVEALRVLKSVDFDGFLVDDHVPTMDDDTLFGHRSRAYATGYVAGLLRAVMALG